MTLILWQSAFSVNVKKIDDQHRHLVDLLNRLHDDLISDARKEDMAIIISELMEYTLSHFKTEEQYFKQYNYPNSRIHLEEHAEFTRKILSFKKDYEAGKIGLTVDVLCFLRDWLTDHIMGSDQSYVTFFEEKGLY